MWPTVFHSTNKIKPPGQPKIISAKIYLSLGDDAQIMEVWITDAAVLSGKPLNNPGML